MERRWKNSDRQPSPWAAGAEMALAAKRLTALDGTDGKLRVSPGVSPSPWAARPTAPLTRVAATKPAPSFSSDDDPKLASPWRFPSAVPEEVRRDD